MVSQLTEPTVAGVVRVGTPEDFATTHLSKVLAAFSRAHPNVAREIITDLTLNLMVRFSQGEFDLVLVKREPRGPSEGVKVWREALAWACASQQAANFSTRTDSLPLVASQTPASIANAP